MLVNKIIKFTVFCQFPSKCQNNTKPSHFWIQQKHLLFLVCPCIYFRLFISCERTIGITQTQDNLLAQQSCHHANSPGTISNRWRPGSSWLAGTSLTWLPCRGMQPCRRKENGVKQTDRQSSLLDLNVRCILNFSASLGNCPTEGWLRETSHLIPLMVLDVHLQSFWQR